MTILTPELLELVPLFTETIPALASTRGSKGYGEGISFGKQTFNSSSRDFHYRVSGKNIPRDKVVYLTSEEGYFSRTVGEKSQIIVAYDEEHKGFRLLEFIPTGSGGVKAKMEAFNDITIKEALLKVAIELAREKKLGDEIQAAIDRGEDLF